MQKITFSLTRDLLLTLLFLFLSFLGYSQSQTFNDPTKNSTPTNTFTVPAGVTQVTVEAWGGGGAGGGCSSLARSTGGGGGTYTKAVSVSVTSGQIITVTVGAGGTGVSDNNGGTGGTSIFASTVPVSAIGGNGGSKNGNATPLNGLGAVAVAGITFNGGAGGAGNATTSNGGTSGGGGGGGGSMSSGAAPTSGTNAGIGGSGSGGNGAVGTSTSGNGTNATALSGGGSGGRNGSNGGNISNRAGGNGAAGQVIISYVSPEINVLGNLISIPNGDPTPLSSDNTDFGSVDTNSGTIIKTFTIQNIGTSTLAINSISVPGSDFTISTAPAPTFPVSIAKASSITFQITFNPATTGPKTAILTIANNDADENPYTFTIQGTGIQTFFDSDGDGVLDNIDIDDDNDGILDSTEEMNCNLSNGTKVNYKFLNETFGAGPRTTINTTYNAYSSYCYEDGSAGTNTTECPNLSSTDLNDGKYTVGQSAQIATWAAQYWYTGKDHTGDTNGRMAMFNASYTPGIFYTALITGALPNIPITYSFWVLNLDRPDAPDVATRLKPNIKVEFRDLNDVLLQTVTTNSINADGKWTQFTANLNLNVSAFKVIFINNETGGNGNDLALDDISITQTLCDLDRDGVADVFDLDADNDGIPDVVEVGLGHLSDGKGKIAVAWVDTNGNGLHDSAEASAALPALDSDGDGIPNYIDLDSDNDSLFDVDESGAGNTNAATGFVNGDGDINGDGVGDGGESEKFREKDTDGNGTKEYFGDGILDIYDYGSGTNIYGNLGQGIANTTYPAATYLLDSDNDGFPDYLDLKSDGINFDITTNKLIYASLKNIDPDGDGIIGIAGTKTDIDHDGILDAFDTDTTKFGSPRDLNTSLYLDFDGRNDYAESTTVLSGLPKASLMAWVDLSSSYNSNGVVLGERNFQIQITGSKQLQVVLNGSTLSFSTVVSPFTTTALNEKQWYHVAATYDGVTLKLFLNGTPVASSAKTSAITTDASLLTIGKNPSAKDSYFKGKIDEVRVFNVALTDSQVQRIVYQEIDATKPQLTGRLIDKNIATPTETPLPFTNMIRYYRMDTYKDDIIDDLSTPAIDVTGTKIYNHKNINIQQAPMPFETITTGTFAIAVHNPLKDIRGLDVTDNDYSIIKVRHDITETANNVDLGMFVDSGKTITMNNNTKLQNDWYLKLDGKIDLQGMSQLLQTTDSELDPTSKGSIERDQKGQANKYNYNYWSSPVSFINSSINNKEYTVDDVLKDGTTINTTPTPSWKNINWVGGYDGSPSDPISLARYWIYKFDNLGNNYANWTQIGETGKLKPGLGFTLKGSGASPGVPGATQNLTFVGKPNNGPISIPVLADQLVLTGNPYPSALDATKFINDNIGSIEIATTNPATDGALYFWEHFSTNSSHNLAAYQGGYGIRNLVGGLAPSATGVDFISGVGATSKAIPNQFIPVGQGFFVFGKTGTGGNIIFNNSQRTKFAKESDADSQQVYRLKPNNKNKKQLRNDTNSSNLENQYTFKTIRLGFNAYAAEFQRQVLLGFMDDKADSEINDGYDAFNIDDAPTDMYFLNGDNELAIQGEGYFDENASFPIGVRVETAGKVSFGVDALENFDTNQAVYIYDAETDIHHPINDALFEIELTEGIVNDRFSLRFTDKTLGIKNATFEDAIAIHYTQSSKILTIANNMKDNTVETASLFDIQGKAIANWKVTDKEQTNIRIQVQSMTSGVYIVKLKTTKGNISKKIIVR